VQSSFSYYPAAGEGKGKPYHFLQYLLVMQEFSTGIYTAFSGRDPETSSG
jgi:hypothetical protein